MYIPGWLLFCIAIILLGAANEYDRLKKENDSLKNRNDELESQAKTFEV